MIVRLDRHQHCYSPHNSQQWQRSFFFIFSISFCCYCTSCNWRYSSPRFISASYTQLVIRQDEIIPTRSHCALYQKCCKTVKNDKNEKLTVERNLENLLRRLEVYHEMFVRVESSKMEAAGVGTLLLWMLSTQPESENCDLTNSHKLFPFDVWKSIIKKFTKWKIDFFLYGNVAIFFSFSRSADQSVAVHGTTRAVHERISERTWNASNHICAKSIYSHLNDAMNYAKNEKNIFCICNFNYIRRRTLSIFRIKSSTQLYSECIADAEIEIQFNQPQLDFPSIAARQFYFIFHT